MAEKKTKKTDEEKKPLSELFQNLQKITEELDDDTLPLEDAFVKYQQGMELLKACHDAVETVEQKLTIMEENQ